MLSSFMILRNICDPVSRNNVLVDTSLYNITYICVFWHDQRYCHISQLQTSRSEM